MKEMKMHVVEERFRVQPIALRSLFFNHFNNLLALFMHAPAPT
jgi:hypothetical protein